MQLPGRSRTAVTLQGGGAGHRARQEMLQIQPQQPEEWVAATTATWAAGQAERPRRLQAMADAIDPLYIKAVQPGAC